MGRPALVQRVTYAAHRRHVWTHAWLSTHAPHSQKQTRSVGKKEPSLCYLLQADQAGAPALVQWLSAEAAALLVDGEAMRMRKTSAGRVSALAVACQSQPTHAACCAVRATRAACILCVIVMLLVCSLARPCCLFITVDTIALPTPATSAPGLRSPLPRLHRDCARPCHICTRTGVARHSPSNRKTTDSALFAACHEYDSLADDRWLHMASAPQDLD